MLNRSNKSALRAAGLGSTPVRAAIRTAAHTAALAGLSLCGACYSGLSGSPSGRDDPSLDSDGVGPGPGGDQDEGPSEDPAGSAGRLGLPASMVRLSAAEYRNTIGDLFSPAMARELELGDDLISDDSVTVGARVMALSRAGVELYDKAAATVAAAAVTDPEWRDRWASCTPKAAIDEECAAQLVETIGLALFRRPLHPEQIERYASVARLGSEALDDFWGGFEYALRGMLVSPSFTHRVEIGRKVDGQRVFDDYEMAARLSYLLWSTTPDPELLDAAAAGELSSATGLEAQLDRMLDDEAKLSRTARRIAQDLFELRSMDETLKDPERFPQADDALYASMHESTMRMAEAVLVEHARGLLDVFDPGVAYVDALLAAHYGVEPPPATFERVELDPEGLRVGLLTEPSLLTKHSLVDFTSPTFRGKFIRERLLCETIPAPPADVEAELPVNADGETRREQIEQHGRNPACVGCHSMMDPLGFGLEDFDALGAVQGLDNGNEIDASGELDGVAFDGPRELTELLLDSDRLAPCMLDRFIRFTTGYHEDQPDPEYVAQITRAFERSDGRLRPMLRSLVMSDHFRFIDDAR